MRTTSTPFLKLWLARLALLVVGGYWFCVAATSLGQFFLTLEPINLVMVALGTYWSIKLALQLSKAFAS